MPFVVLKSLTFVFFPTTFESAIMVCKNRRVSDGSLALPIYIPLQSTVPLLSGGHRKHTETKRITLSIIPCIDSNLSVLAPVEFADATLSGIDSESDSSAEGESGDGSADRLVGGLTDGPAGGRLVELSAGLGGVGAFSVGTLVLAVHMRQKSLPLEPMWQANSLCIGLSPNRAQTNGTTTTFS